MQPLDGIRIIDCTKVLAGPLCTQYLSDLGAEVIKVEPILVGDDTRLWPPLRGEFGSVFLSVNRNKKSIALDLKTDEGKGVIRDLMRTSDVLIESFGTGVAAKLGIDYESAAAQKPDIIHCSISGFGRTGPLKNALGYEVILQAFAGVMSITGEPDGGPIRIPISPVDQGTGMHAMSGILAALIQRGKTGKGCSLEVSLFETAMGLLGHNLQSYWETGNLPKKFGSGHESICPYQAFAASDGPILVGIANDNLWGRFCRAVGREDLISDPKFKTNPDRVQNFGATVSLVQSIIGERLRSEWMSLFEKIGVPCAPINSLEEVSQHPHTKARGIVMDYDHPDLGQMKSVGYPVIFDGSARTVKSAPPRLGQHTDEVLLNIGYSSEQIEKMERSGAILRG